MGPVDHPAPHHREPPSTYRRRRVAVGLAAVAMIVIAVLLVGRLGGAPDATSATETTGTAPGTAGGPGDSDDSDATDTAGALASTTTTTALVIPGFASPQDYLACVKERESRGDYAAVSPDGQFFGAYQIDQVTWNNTTQHAGLTYLYDIQPNLVAPADQDTLAMALLEWQGTSPWAGDC